MMISRWKKEFLENSAAAFEIQISMTQDGVPRDNAIAERVNGILKTEWLYDDHFVGFEDDYRRVAEVINLCNNKRPHLSLSCKTPSAALTQSSATN